METMLYWSQHISVPLGSMSSWSAFLPGGKYELTEVVLEIGLAIDLGDCAHSIHTSHG